MHTSARHILQTLQLLFNQLEPINFQILSSTHGSYFHFLFENNFIILFGKFFPYFDMSRYSTSTVHARFPLIPSSTACTAFTFAKGISPGRTLVLSAAVQLLCAFTLYYWSNNIWWHLFTSCCENIWDFGKTIFF